MITIENLYKSYNNKIILDNINYKFYDNSVNVLMGESGAGKTTLFKIMMGIEFADSGKITGVKNVSAVFQEDRLIEDISAVDNIIFACSGISKMYIEQELEKCIPSDSIHKKITELSGGMKRRVCIVRAMLSKSDTVLLDEPFTGLDDVNKALMIKYIKDNKKDRNIIVITHDKKDALDFETDICVLTRDKAIVKIQ